MGVKCVKALPRLECMRLVGREEGRSTSSYRNPQLVTANVNALISPSLGVCTRSHASFPQITRHKAASVTFGNDLADITDGEKIKHGLLVNLGKNIARQVSSLCASAMRVYTNEKHKPSSQLFHCIN